MAKKDTTTSSSTDLNTAVSKTYTKGLITDYNDSYVPEGVWISAINAVTNSHKGDEGTIGNEPSNTFCAEVPYTIIGLVRRDSDVWIVFSTNNVLSEIGYFRESSCEYTKVLADKCLNFKKEYLITGVAQYNFDCTWSVFFADGLNPDRSINLDNPPYLYTWDRTNPDCPIKVFSDCLDCDQTRLSYLMNPPCVTVKKAVGAGSLFTGSYQAVVCYTINGQKVTNYFTPSNVQGIWDHDGVAGGLEITVSDLDTRFEEYELVIVSTVNAQTVAKRIGYFSTSQDVVFIDNYNDSLPTIDLKLIPLVIPVYEKSDKMFAVNDYLLRSGIYSKYDFNYQPLANNIVTYWQEIEYPSDYYYKGGSNTSYMRDEQYAFFIRWIYNDGDKSASYHIPGRAAFPTDILTLSVSNDDVLYPDDNQYWQVYNTATITNNALNEVLPDGGIVTKEGLMGYWQSSEKYPINKPEVWADLCGLNIRHHKFPDNCISHIHNQGGNKIYMLGVKFENIQHPLDNDGNPIVNIIGYEILRGSREGNRTVVAKGLINNMREYTSIGDRKLLYQNYPYNDLRPDKFLRTSINNNSGDNPDNDGSPLSTYKKDYYSFHSPETNFSKPFLSYDEVRLYSREYGLTSGSFEYPFGHPKHKLITNTSYLLALLFGLGIGLKQAFGTKSNQATADTITANIAGGLLTGTTIGLAGINPGSLAALASYALGAPTSLGTGNYGQVSAAGAGFGNWGNISFPTVNETGGDLTGLDFRFFFPGYTTKIGQGVFDVLKYATFLSTIKYWSGQGLDAALRVIYELIPFRQYALQYNSHGFYSNYKPVCSTKDFGNTRRQHVESIYVKDQIQAFDLTYSINNLYRNNYVCVKIKGIFPEVSAGDGSIEDKSRNRVRDTSLSLNNPTNSIVTSNTSAYYAALKIDLENQYGQLEGIVQLPLPMCYQVTSPKLLNKRYTSDTLFGGDIYINRYTEKNPFFFFVNWLYDVPNGTELDYREYSDVLYPRYWANFTKFDRSSNQTPIRWNTIINWKSGQNPLINWLTAASAYHHLDRNTGSTNTFAVTNAWFYLFNNGIRDFFVESEINLAYRDYGDMTSQRFFDYKSYTDYNRMFRTDIIQSSNYYKYDYSLSVSKLLNNYISFSAILSRRYDPLVSESCYSYYSGRVLYSLQQQSEQARESWRIYLPNNYKDFENDVTAFKPINRTGGLILFQDAEPTSFTGVDQLETAAGTKITIGDGGLFAQPFQSLVNADDEFEYASCQDTRSVVNTPYGTFWMSRNTGKILQYYGGNIVDIAMNGMRYWFAEHLPYVLTAQYPDFPFTENTVVGLGCQAVYDAQYEIIYFCKKDYKCKYPESVKFDTTGNFWYFERQSGTEIITLGDPVYFEDCSWTISYDPKSKMWISFHDWHPTYVIGVNDHFYSINDRTFWKHNDTCNSFCNFYGDDYAFEVEVPVNTGANITTIKSLEYTLEVLNYSEDCIDPYHVLDENFDYAMIYNTEQNSGLLKLNLKPKNPYALLQFPKVLPDKIEIMFAKEENKYRFNQFWDSTKDRGEFSGIQYRMFNTEQNGYRKVLNPTFIDYNKSPLQRKKFRHYGNRLIMGKTVSDNLKYNLKVSSVKETSSPR